MEGGESHFIVFHSNVDLDNGVRARVCENLYLNRNDGERARVVSRRGRKWDVPISKLVGIILDDTFIFASITRWKSL